jgi:hypothetical protein
MQALNPSLSRRTSAGSQPSREPAAELDDRLQKRGFLAIAFAPALLVTAIGGDTHRHVLSVSVHVRHRIRSREAPWKGSLDNIFRIFPRRCAPQPNHEYLRLVPLSRIPKGLSVSPLRGEHASSPVGSRKQSSRLACYSSRSRLSHAPATGHRVRNRRS